MSNQHNDYKEVAQSEDEVVFKEGLDAQPTRGLSWDRVLSSKRTNFTKRDCIIVSVITALAVVAIVTTLSLGIPKIREKQLLYYNTSFPVSSSPRVAFPAAIVLTDGAPCAQIGKDVLQKGGTAVDAAIATLLCNGVANPQSMGLGGGFLMTVYIRENKTADVIDARETAPGAATTDMFANGTSSEFGGLAVAVPGEIRGYWLAHQKYGRLNWSDLFEPTVQLCRSGIPVSAALARHMDENREAILNETSLREIFVNPNTSDLYREGDTMTRPVLATTLEKIAEKGADELYTGDLAKNLIDDIQKFGGIVTLKDMQDYQAKSRKIVSSRLGNGERLLTVPPPGSGAVLAFIINILRDYMLTPDNMASFDASVLTYHRLVEAFKFGYARREELGDEDFVDNSQLLANLTSQAYASEIRSMISDLTTSSAEYYGRLRYGSSDFGTAQVSILDSNGDAVSVTSTINSYFGSKRRSQSTGIILNDEMDDFCSPNKTNSFGLFPSPANSIAPGKRPLSSMCPSIVVDADDNVRFVVGAAGGSRIITALSQVLTRLLWLKEDLKEAVDALRLHHQLHPNVVYYEEKFPVGILHELKKIGHRCEPDTFTSAVYAIVRGPDGQLHGNVDYRKGGRASGF